jgi:hypothetical protein
MSHADTRIALAAMAFARALNGAGDVARACEVFR